MARWIVPIVVLPGNVLVVVPWLILWLSKGTRHAAVVAAVDSVQFWLAIVLAVPGALLAIGSATLFFRFGNGTAAPWDPPKKLVVRGAYRYVRNPMISGVILILIAESLFFQSWMLTAWATLFFVVNSIYFPLVEEPGLVSRFGRDYETYRRHVPRWIPRLTAWDPSTEPDNNDLPDGR